MTVIMNGNVEKNVFLIRSVIRSVVVAVNIFLLYHIKILFYYAFLQIITIEVKRIYLVIIYIYIRVFII